jgi:hypothetical protein
LLEDHKLFALLTECDRDLAAEARAAGCPFCGGALHCADYPRKPRGVPAAVEAEYSRRFSFCCAEDGCRHRCTPASLRFLGARVYVGAVVVLLSALRHGLTPERVARLRETVGVSRRTLERWREWWLTRFADGSFWRQARALLASPVEESALPASLLERFIGAPRERVIALLRFLAPLSRGQAC